MPVRRLALVAPLVGAALVFPATARAQAPAARPTVERPAPFDSAGRILVVSPALAARLALRAPDWPVAGPFVEARLFRVDGDGSVLAVVRPGGSVERWRLDDPARLALVAAVSRAVTASAAGMRADTNVVVSEPAGRAFVRTQTLRGLAVYGPAAAALMSDATGSPIAYAVTSAGTFLVALGVSQQQAVTRAQNDLAGNLSIGLAATGIGLAHLANAPGSEPYGGAALVGGVAGAILGVKLAAGMTDAEAASTGSIGFLSATTAFGAASALGAWDRSREGRAATAAGIAALGTGYLLGPRYARRRAYRVTAGDAQALLPASLVGAGLAAGVTLLGTEDGRALAGAATAGWVAGALLGDRALVRPVDHTESEAALLRLGTAVGAGAATAIAGAAGGEEKILISAAIGGLLGLAITEGALKPGRGTTAGAAGPAARLRTGATPARGLRGATLELSPSGAAFAAAGVRGRFPVARVTF